MQPKTLKILGVVLLILVASWGLTLVASRYAEPKDEYLWEKAKDAKRLAIGDTVLSRSGGGDWSVEKPFKAKADHAKIEDFLGKVSKITLSDVVSSDPARQEYFMVTPSIGIRFQGFLDNGSTPALDVFVGKSGSEYDSILLRRPDSSDVVEGRGVPRYEFEQGASKWADRTIAKIDSASIRSIELRSGKEVVLLKHADGHWRLNGASAALSTSVVSGAVEPMLAKLAGLEAEEVTQEAALSSTTVKDLRTPELHIIVRYADGIASGSAKVIEKTLEVSIAPKGSAARCAVHKKGDALVYMVSSWHLDSFRKKQADFKPEKAAGRS